MSSSVGSFALLSFAALLSCSKAESTIASGGTGGQHSGNSAGAGGLAPCLERPNELPRPPSGQLPCELIPPGLRR